MFWETHISPSSIPGQISMFSFGCKVPNGGSALLVCWWTWQKSQRRSCWWGILLESVEAKESWCFCHILSCCSGLCFILPVSVAALPLRNSCGSCHVSSPSPECFIYVPHRLTRLNGCHLPQSFLWIQADWRVILLPLSRADRRLAARRVCLYRPGWGTAGRQAAVHLHWLRLQTEQREVKRQDMGGGESFGWHL